MDTLRGVATMRARGVRCVTVVLTALALVWGLAPLGAAQTCAGADEPYARTTRVRACTNVEAAVAWSHVTSDAGSRAHALLARADVFADALASGGVQCATGQAETRSGAPLLLTPPDALAPPARGELDRLDVGEVHILGGTAAVGQHVEDELRSAGYATHRHAGASRVETAIELARTHFTDLQHVLLARAFGDEADATRAFADSIAAGAAACGSALPILVTDTANLSPPVRTFLSQSNVQYVTIVGGSTAVSAQVEDQIRSLGAMVDRVAGSTRAGTAVALAEEFFEPLVFAEDVAEDVGRVALVDGFQANSWASGFAAALSAPGDFTAVLLSSGTALPPETAQYLSSLAGVDMALVCGPFVEDEACDEAARLLGHANGTTVTLREAAVRAGEDLDGTVLGEAIDSAKVSGCGLTDRTLYDSDLETDALEFAMRIPGDQPAGVCQLAFVVYTGDAEQKVVKDLEVLPPGVTDAPELVEVRVDGGDPYAATVTAHFVFDEKLDAASVEPAKFRLYRNDATSLRGSSAAIDRATVTVSFPTYIDDDPYAAPVHPAEVAAVDYDAIRDFEGKGNPIGDVLLGEAGTAAPDLVAVTVTEEVDAAGEPQAVVTYEFDEAVAQPIDPARAEAFSIIFPDGARLRCKELGPWTPGTKHVDCQVFERDAASDILLARDAVVGTVDENVTWGAQQGPGNALGAEHIASAQH